MYDVRTYSVARVLKDGTKATIRAVCSDDRERIVTAFRNLERETVYSRFFTFKDVLREEELERIAAIDFVRNVMLVVTAVADNDEIVIGSGSYSAYEATDGALAAEVAFIVEEDYQGCGVASSLLAHLATIARDHGIARFEAEVLPENRPMLRVFARSGLPMHRQGVDAVVRLSLAL
jgi:RimJ/RimL family protein N-acetyltransferase